VLYAETAEQAAKLVVEIAKKHDVKKVIKSKSMVSEEMALNKALEAAGVTPVETDLGEYILQINDNEPPSHIIAPVIHKDKEEVADLFAKVHNKPRLTDIHEMTREAREVLRPHFQRGHVHHHAAQGACGRDRHRKGIAYAVRSGDCDAIASTFCHRAVDFQLFLAADRAARQQ
jgi:hypothetical protein